MESLRESRDADYNRALLGHFSLPGLQQALSCWAKSCEPKTSDNSLTLPGAWDGDICSSFL